MIISHRHKFIFIKTRKTAPAVAVRSWVGEEIWNRYFKFCFERNPWDKTVSDFYWSGGTEVYGSVESFLHSEKASSRSDFDLYSIQGMVAVDRVYKYERWTRRSSNSQPDSGLSAGFECRTTGRKANPESGMRITGRF